MTKTPQTVESMKAASAILGVPLEELKKAKASGCPAFKASNRIHLPTLRAWLDQRPKDSVPERTSLPSLSSDEMEQLGTLDASLKAAIRDEIEAGRLLQQARQTGNSGSMPDLTRAVGIARKNRMAAEAAVTAQKIAQGGLITMHSHKTEMYRLWTPFCTALRALPPKLAIKLVGLDDVASERLLAASIETILGETQAICKGSEENMAAANLEFWMRGHLMADPSGTVLLGKVREVLASTERLVAGQLAGKAG